MIDKNTFIAINRFGLGAGAKEVARAKEDYKTYLYSQISNYQIKPEFFRKLPSTEIAIKDSRDFIKNTKSMKDSFISKEKIKQTKKFFYKKTKEEFIDEVALRLIWATKTPTPFMERMVRFWSNHFTISTTKKEIAKFAAPYERDVIRPNILGKFSDLVLAVVKHPAMLIYLDNIHSIGPNSKIGKKRNKGLNENLARELLELHILGVNGGYSQKDVEELAKMLTGWTIDIKTNSPHKNGFYFQKNMHEPGDKILLGKKYPESGEKELEQAIKDLCQRPETAKFIATKLATHFISDNPPKSAIRRLATNFIYTGGDLKKLTETLIKMPEMWRNAATKIKTPEELIISTIRCLDLENMPLNSKSLVSVLNELNQLSFRALSPKGWEDTEQRWVSPEAILKRIEWARFIAHKSRNNIKDIDILFENTIGQLSSAETKFAVLNAPSKVAAVTLLLASPEFQRR